MLCVLSITLLATAMRAQTMPPTSAEPPLATFKFSDAENRAGAPPETSTIAAWEGSYEGQLLFLMEFDGDWVKGKVDGHDDPGLPFYFSKGRFFHVAGSDPRLFLAKVAEALGRRRR